MHSALSEINHQIVHTYERLLPAIREDARRLLPDWPEASIVKLAPLPVDSSHVIAVVEAPEWGSRRLFLKGQRLAEPMARGLETEFRLLAEVGPAIERRHPSIRCPRVLARYDDPEAMLMEFVDGRCLQSLWFGLGHRASRMDLQRLISLSGTWLGLFHRSTRAAAVGNPFNWAVGSYDAPRARAAVQRVVGRDEEGHLRERLWALAERHRGLCRTRCLIHGDFIPAHVIVEREGVCIIDLAAAKLGFLHEDLTLFLAYPEVVVPWRRAMARHRIGARGYRAHLLRAYEAAAAPLDEIDQVLLAIGKVLALIRFVQRAEPGADRPPSVKGTLLLQYRRQMLRRACRRLAAMLARG